VDQFCTEGWKFALKDENQLVRFSEYGSGSGSRHSTGVNSRQNGSPHVRFFSAKRGRKSKQHGRSRALREPILPVFPCGMVMFYARRTPGFPLEFTKTVRNDPLLERFSQRLPGRFP
jgi:hypothetical protein